MFKKEIEEKLSRDFSSTTCACCGQKHKVVVKITENTSSLLVVDSYPEGACEVFRLGVREYVSVHMKDLILM